MYFQSLDVHIHIIVKSESSEKPNEEKLMPLKCDTGENCSE